MSYTWDTVNTAIIPRLLGFKRPQLFKGAGYICEKLWAGKKVEKINMFEVPLKHASDATPQGLQALGELQGSHGEILNKGYDNMVFGGDLAIISHKEFRAQGGAERFINLIDERISGKLEGQRNAFNASIWRRTAAVPASDTQSLQMNGMYDVYDKTIDIHNLDYANYSIWQPIVYDASADLTGTPGTREGITQDPTSEVYIENMLDLVVENFRARGILPNDGVIVMPAAMMSAYRSILRAQDRLTPGKLMVKLGYDSVNYRGYDVGVDDWMSVNQTGDTDGWIVGVPMSDITLYVNDPNGISVGGFDGDMKLTYRGAQLLFDRQLAIHNRHRFIFITNVWNKKSIIKDAIET